MASNDISEISSFVLEKNRVSEEKLLEKKAIMKRYFNYKTNLKEDSLKIKDDVYAYFDNKKISNNIITDELLRLIDEYTAVYIFPILTNIINNYSRVLLCVDEYMVIKYDIKEFNKLKDLFNVYITNDSNLREKVFSIYKNQIIEDFNDFKTLDFNKTRVINEVIKIVIKKIEKLTIKEVYSLYGITTEIEKFKIANEESYINQYKDNVFLFIDNFIDYIIDKKNYYFVLFSPSSNYYLYTAKTVEEIMSIEEKYKKEAILSLKENIKLTFLAEQEISIYFSEEKELKLGGKDFTYHYADEIHLYDTDPKLTRSSNTDFNFVKVGKKNEIIDVSKEDLKYYKRKDLSKICGKIVIEED